MDILKSNDFKCNAQGRKFANERISVITPRKALIDYEALQYAEEIGGLHPGYKFKYPNAQGGISKARVYSITSLPKKMENPFLYIFGGVMSAFLQAGEILRMHYKKSHEILPLISSGKEGNKGLFEKIFYRPNGTIRRTEYDSYIECMAQIFGKEYAYRYYTEHDDTDTEGNLLSIINFARQENLKVITLVICTGNPYYDKRILAEWGLMMKDAQFADIEVNLVIVHSHLLLMPMKDAVKWAHSLTGEQYKKNPVKLTPIKGKRGMLATLQGALPEMCNTEIVNGYAAASVAPLAKDTVTIDGKASSKPERYLMPWVKEADWNKLRNIIENYSNMGWPDYQKILYHTSHAEAVYNIICADLFAKASFTAEDYDNVDILIKNYQDFLGGKFDPKKQTLADYLRNSPHDLYFGME